MNKILKISKAQIKTIEQELSCAMINSNINALDSMLHENLLFNIPGGQVITKQLDLNSYKTGLMNWSSIQILEQEISLIEDTAIISATLLMKGLYGDHIVDGEFKIIRVWKQCNGGLKVIAGSSMSLQ